MVTTDRRAGITSSPTPLPLGVLRCLARFLQSVLAPFLLARIAREKPGLLEDAAQLRVEIGKRPGDAVAQRARLAADAAAFDLRQDVVATFGLREPERLGDHHAVRDAREVILKRAAV